MAEMKGRRRAFWLGLSVGLVIVLLLVIGIYHYLYQPYEQMWEMGMRELRAGEAKVDPRRIRSLMAITDSVHVSFVDPVSGKGHRDLFCPL